MTRVAKPKSLLCTMVLSVLVLLAIGDACLAQDVGDWSRARKADIFFIFQMLGGDEVTSFDGFATHETDDATAFGFGIGANATDNFYLNMELLFGSTDLLTTIPSIPGAAATMDVSLWQLNLNLDFNLLKGRITPLVGAGVGLFGWSADEASETNFSYNVGAGGRWDITDNIVLRVIYRMTWTTMEDADDAWSFDGVLATIGYMW